MAKVYLQFLYDGLTHLLLTTEIKTIKLKLPKLFLQLF